MVEYSIIMAQNFTNTNKNNKISTVFYQIDPRSKAEMDTNSIRFREIEFFVAYSSYDENADNTCLYNHIQSNIQNCKF